MTATNATTIAQRTALTPAIRAGTTGEAKTETIMRAQIEVITVQTITSSPRARESPGTKPITIRRVST
jgi:hypothetical protein